MSEKTKTKAAPKAKAKAPAKAKAKTPAKSKAPKEKKERAPSARSLLKSLVIKNPKISLDDCLDALEKAGHEPAESSVSTWKHDTVNTIRMLDEAGLLAPSYKPFG